VAAQVTASAEWAGECPLYYPPDGSNRRAFAPLIEALRYRD
jgi:hypothetical protein